MSTDEEEEKIEKKGKKLLKHKGKKRERKGKVTGQDLSLIHARYDKVLKIFKKENCSLAHAMELYGVARNTLRDFIGICELKIKDKEKYQTITAVERDRSGKPAVRQ